MNRRQRNHKEIILKKAETEINRKYTDNKKRLQSGMELTREGWGFCITAGMLETISILAVFRIDLLYVPLLVFLVLWASFGILTSVFLVGTGYHLVSKNMKTDLCASAKQNSFSIPDQRTVWNVKKAS